MPPISPGATRVPSSSTTRTETPGSGGPDRAGDALAVERVRRDHAGLGHAVALEDRWPVRCSNCANVSGSSGAEPETNRRIVAAVARVEAGSASSRV